MLEVNGSDRGKVTRIFSTLVNGVSKARTKMAAAQREMVRQPMK